MVTITRFSEHIYAYSDVLLWGRKYYNPAYEPTEEQMTFDKAEHDRLLAGIEGIKSALARIPAETLNKWMDEGED